MSSSTASTRRGGARSTTTAVGPTRGATGGGPPGGVNWLVAVPAVGLAFLYFVFQLLRPAYPVASPPGIVAVTGTSSGIGNAIANHLAEQGYNVFAGVRRQQSYDAWNRVNHPKITPVKLDVTDPRDIQAAVQQVEKARKRHKGLKLAGIVGNAGLGFHMPIEHHNMDDIRRLFDVNFLGNVALTQAFMPLIREDKARVIYISSLAGRITQPKEGIYSASKKAIEALGDALRQELYPHQVSVSLVEPGFVATPLIPKVLDTEEVGNSTSAASTYPRLYSSKYFKAFGFGAEKAGKPEAVAKVVHKALTDHRPKTRYTCTNFLMVPTWLAIRAKWILPDRLFDKIVA